MKQPRSSSRPATASADSAAVQDLLPPDQSRPLPLNRYLVFCGIAITGLVADLVTKQALFAWLGLPQEDKYFWIVKDYIGFQTAVNRGALFGLGAGYWWLFSILSVVAAVAIVVWLFYFRAAHDRLLNVALACVMAGIFGNLYDRLGLWDASGLPAEYEHGVRDWILFRYRQHTWPNFNIADCLLVCGAGLLMLHAWLGPHVPATAQAKDQ
ncbi:signal peptidase II [Anatilimnocola sp. NA78]|uniref:signal peptidase II n=1 Tax=Anatilimnocola sp. NA78 TaxID=3415683 RepID=UPI003CE596B4